jgi:hypothetical protein
MSNEAAFATGPAENWPIAIGEPHLSGEERGLFDRALSTGVRKYMEFGLGGSTLAAARAGASEIVAVDSDAVWVEAARKDPEISPLIARGVATIIHADIGPVGEWGRPYDRGSIGLWPRYIADPWAEWSRRGGLPDFIYVDGRFRVASVLSIAFAFADLRAAARGPKILMHDMSDARPGYDRVYIACEDVEVVGTLRLLSLRRNVDWTAALVTFIGALASPE